MIQNWFVLIKINSIQMTKTPGLIPISIKMMARHRDN